MLAIGAVLNLTLFPENPGFVGLQPHPTLFVVLFISLRYGFRAAMMAIILSALVYGALLLQLADVRTYLYLLDPPYSTPLVILFPLGVVVGLLSQRHLDRTRDVLASNEELQLENSKLRGEHEALRDVNLELAGRVVGAEGTVGQLYEFAKQLNVVDKAKVFEGLLQLLGEALGADESTIWRIAGGHLEFFSSSLNASADSKLAPDFARFDHLFDDRGVLALHDIPESDRTDNFPFLVGKLGDGQHGALIAYVAVDSIPFARYNAETVRLFRMIVEWASTSLGNVSSAQAQEAVVGAANQGAAPPAANPFTHAPATVDEQRGSANRSVPPGSTSPIGDFAPEAMYNGTVDRSVHELADLRAQYDLQQAHAVTSSPDTANRDPQPRFAPEQDLATVLHNIQFDEAANPARRSGRPSFIPSRSVILLSEAGANNPGATGTTAPAPPANQSTRRESPSGQTGIQTGTINRGTKGPTGS